MKTKSAITRSLIVSTMITLIAFSQHAKANLIDTAMETTLEYQLNSAYHIKSRLQEYARETSNQALYDVVAATTLVFSNELSLDSVAFASADERREVHISMAFIRHLTAFVKLTLKEPLTTYNSNNTTLYAYQQDLINHAITDIILHELGHHALDLFYGQYTPPRYVPQMEQQVSQWTTRMKNNLELDQNEMGRLLTLFSVLDHKLAESKANNAMTRTVKNLQNKIDYECLDAFSEQAEMLCENLADTLYAEYAFTNGND